MIRAWAVGAAMGLVASAGGLALFALRDTGAGVFVFASALLLIFAFLAGTLAGAIVFATRIGEINES